MTRQIAFTDSPPADPAYLDTLADAQANLARIEKRLSKGEAVYLGNPEAWDDSDVALYDQLLGEWLTAMDAVNALED